MTVNIKPEGHSKICVGRSSKEVIICQQGKLQVVNIDNGRLTRSYHSSEEIVTDLVCTKDGIAVMSCRDGRIVAFDLELGKCVDELHLDLLPLSLIPFETASGFYVGARNGRLVPVRLHGRNA